MVNVEPTHYVVTLQNQTIPVAISTYEDIMEQMKDPESKVIAFWDFGRKCYFTYRSDLITHLIYQSSIVKL
jgi:hypothetical protein